jgi:putative ABC transport system substrate-binding protein
MRRRQVIAALGGAMTAWPLVGHAQPKAVPVIGFMSGRSPAVSTHLVAAFRQGLTEIGFVEGKNLAVEYRWAEGRYDLLPAFAADFVGRKVDVIVAGGATDTARAAQEATSTIPIVFVNGSDPVEDRLVASLARPGGNVTGVTFLAQELNSKLLELARELVPKAATIGLLVNQTNSTSERQRQDLQKVARQTSVELLVLSASTASELDAAFDTLIRGHAGALIVVPEAFFISQRDRLATLAIRHSVPTIYGFREFVAAGGLMSYGASFASSFHQVGVYAGRILKGTKPADLPVVQPAKFELVINMETARALGLTIPRSVLARADEVIE